MKLTDFGIAKAMNKREHTGTGVVKGKVAFMSPEQAMGKPIDQRSDLFSVGTVLYLMVTRARPFEGPTDLETLLRVQKGDFRPPEETSPDLPPEVAAVVARAMRKEPADRYQSADEMLGDVERVLRTAFQPVGQTELKRWLIELSARDGVAPISQSSATVHAHNLDADQDRDGRAGRRGRRPARHRRGGHRRSRGDLAGGRQRRRDLPAREPPAARQTLPDLPVPEDAESMSNLSGRSELALPIPEEEGGRPGRRRARRGSGFSILFVGALLVAGAWFAGKYARTYLRDLVRGRRDRKFGWFGQFGELEGSGGRQRACRGPTDCGRAADGQAGGCVARRSGVPATGRDRGGTVPARHAEPAAAHEAGHEAAPRRRGGAKDFVRRDLAGLKMAPDPSLLPAPSPPSAPKTADSPPAAPPASETP